MSEKHPRVEEEEEDGISDVYGPYHDTKELPCKFFVIENAQGQILRGKGKKSGVEVFIAFTAEKSVARLIMEGRVPVDCFPSCVDVQEARDKGVKGIILDPPTDLGGGAYYYWHPL